MPSPKPPPNAKTNAEGTLRLALDARCLDNASTDRIKKRRDQHVTRQIRTIDGVVTRTLCPVSFFGRQQLADVVTGSLYDVETGQCLTGRREIVEAAPSPTVARKAASPVRPSKKMATEA
ncbi:MAG TPA: hypothetical protein VF389_02695, partial [Woeseiaceae bacterium]